MLQGNTTNLPLQNIFQTLALNQQEGILSVVHQRVERHIAIRTNGISLLCERSFSSELLQRITSRLKILSAGEYENVVSTAAGDQCPGDTLIDRHVLSASQHAAVIREQLLEYLYEIFEWRDANYRFEVRPISGDRMIFQDPAIVPMLEFPVNAILMEVARREDEWQRIREKIPSEHQIYRFSGSLEQAEHYSMVSNLGVDRVRRMLSLLDGQHSVESIVENSQIPAFLVCSTLRAVIDDNLAHPISIEDKRALAEGYRQKLQTDRIIATYQSILDEDPHDGDTRKKLVVLLERKKVPETELLPHYRALAKITEGEGDDVAATQYLARILQHQPRDIDALEQMSRLHLRAKKEKAAGQTLRNYVQVARRSRQFSRGATFLLEIAENEKAPAWATQEAAHMYLLAGDPQEAAIHYDKVAKIYSNNRDLDRLEKVIEKLEVCDTRLAQRWRKYLNANSSGGSKAARSVIFGAIVFAFSSIGFAFYEWDARVSYAEMLEEVDQIVATGEIDSARRVLDEFESTYPYSLVTWQVGRERSRLNEITAKEVPTPTVDPTLTSDRPLSATDLEHFQTKGMSLKNQGEYEAALNHYQSLDASRLPSHLVPMILSEIDGLEKYFRESRELLRRAQEAERQGNLAEASRTIRRISEKYPHSPVVREMRYPMLLEVLPPEALVMVDHQTLDGPPYLIRVAEGHQPIVTVAAPSFQSQTVSLDPRKGSRAVLHLQKEEKWSHMIKSYVEARPLSFRGRAFFGTRSGTVVCFDAQQGNQRWTFELEGLGDCLGAIRRWGDHIIFTGTDQALYRVEVERGEGVYRLPLPGVSRSGPSEPDQLGRAFLMTTKGTLVAVQVNRSEILWTKEFAGAGEIAPIVATKAVIAVTRTGFVAAFDPETGERVWSRDLKTRVSTPPFLLGDKLILGLEDRRLFAISETRGEDVWETRLSSPPRGELAALASGDFVVGTERGQVLALRGHDGATMWEQPLEEDGVASGVAVARGYVFAMSRGGVLGVFRESDGLRVWSFDAQSSPSCPIHVADHMVFMAVNDQWIRAVAIPEARKSR